MYQGKFNLVIRGGGGAVEKSDGNNSFLTFNECPPSTTKPPYSNAYIPTPEVPPLLTSLVFEL